MSDLTDTIATGRATLGTLDEIRNLEAEVKRLRTALENVALGHIGSTSHGIHTVVLTPESWDKVRMALARAALEQQPQAEGAPDANERTRE